MASFFTTLIPGKEAEATQETQYTAIGVVAIIDKFTVTNTSAVNATLSVNLIAVNQSAADYNLIMKEHTINPGTTYTCPELVGHVIPTNFFISTLASAASSLTIRCSGREIR